VSGRLLFLKWLCEQVDSWMQKKVDFSHLPIQFHVPDSACRLLQMRPGF
jgi:hypothetical protein